MRETLTPISLATLRDLRHALGRGALALPLESLALRARGLDEASAELLVRASARCRGRPCSRSSAR